MLVYWDIPSVLRMLSLIYVQTPAPSPLCMITLTDAKQPFWVLSSACWDEAVSPPNLLQGSPNTKVQFPHILSPTLSAGRCLTYRTLSARPSVDLAPCLAEASPACPGTRSHAELLGWWWLSPLWEAIVSETHSDSRHAKLLPGPAWGLIVFSRRANLLARCRYQV